MDACPPYSAKEDTGSSKDGGMLSVSGPNPSHCCCDDLMMTYSYSFAEDVWNQVRTHFLDAYRYTHGFFPYLYQ